MKCLFLMIGGWAFCGLIMIDAIGSRRVLSAMPSRGMRMGYSKPGDTMGALWVITEAGIDRQNGFDLQNIYLSGGDRPSQDGWRRARGFL